MSDRSPEAGESLAGRLAALIESRQPGLSDLAIENLSLVGGGNARLAWRFDAAWRESDGRRRQPCILLLQARAGQLESDIGHEFAVLQALTGSAAPAPAALWLDADGFALGAPGLVLERLPGVTDIAALRAPEPAARNRAITLALADAAAALHRFDWRGRLHDAPPALESVATAQIALWETQFLKHRLEPHPAIAYAFDWLRRHAPPAERVSLVHGDFRLGNVLYEGDRITGLLDWEMAHLGDPVEDIAWVYRALWTPEKHVTLEAFIDRYASAGGPPVDPENLLFYRLFGEIKHAVISITAARSFADRRTGNLRMADRMNLVPDCVAQFFDWLPA